MKRIALVACGKRKLDRPEAAQFLYTGTLFAYTRQYVATEAHLGHYDAWYVLSAKHGLVEPTARIAPYDDTLTGKRVSERTAWAFRVACDLVEREGAEMDVTVFAGQAYGECLVSLLAVGGCVVREPLAGLRIGERLSWLRQRLDAQAARLRESA